MLCAPLRNFAFQLIFHFGCAEKEVANLFVCVYPKRQSFLSFIRSTQRDLKGWSQKKRREMHLWRRSNFFINIHNVRYHSGARHQSQQVVKTLFLISSTHTPFFTVLLFSAFLVPLYLFPWITLCLSRSISVWMCTGGRFTRWET